MEKCDGRVGCHACVSFLQMLEIKIDAFSKAVNEGATPNVFFTIKELEKLIKAFRKGE